MTNDDDRDDSPQKRRARLRAEIDMLLTVNLGDYSAVLAHYEETAAKAMLRSTVLEQRYHEARLAARVAFWQYRHALEIIDCIRAADPASDGRSE
jgi:hypothetical protein